MMDQWCNNCGKSGHTFSQCKIPITSFGCIVFRINPETNFREYLMICRRFSIAYLEFIRGKYAISDIKYITGLLQQMTNKEREIIGCADYWKIRNATWCSGAFDDNLSLKRDICAGSDNKYYNEDVLSCEKFGALCRQYNLSELLKGCLDEGDKADSSELEEIRMFPNNGWDQPEWGFPKGRREYKETDYFCAIREFHEETGINISLLQQIKNIIPIEENFMGSNFKTYKHKYYLMYMNYADTMIKTNFQKSEVSCIAWKTLDESIASIRPYNFEKKRLIKNIDDALNEFPIIFL
jgi:8-oxo-dGTP pyrophosphatase MutT (NUDIX family)